MPLFLFLFFIFLRHTYNHSITFVQYIYPSPFAEASLHFFIACTLSGDDLPVVPSRESNSGLPYSKPTRYQLSHAAHNWSMFLIEDASLGRWTQCTWLPAIWAISQLGEQRKHQLINLNMSDSLTSANSVASRVQRICLFFENEEYRNCDGCKIEI